MGHKKRNTPRSKPSQPTSPPSPDSSAPAAINSKKSPNHASKPPISELEGITNGGDIIATANPCSPDDDDSSVKVECERAFILLRCRNYYKALRLIKELCLKHKNSSHSARAMVHAVQGTVCVHVARIIDDPNVKQRYLKDAIDSARIAVTLSPNSIVFSHFYANALNEAALDGKDYQDVVNECNRGLLIKNPIDPLEESLLKENQLRIYTVATYEARVADFQNELCCLGQNACISSRMKKLDSEDEERFRLIPFKRVPEDPMKLKLVEERRPNEIKKATKTPEERRKEIEVKVAAARLLQHKLESPRLWNDVDSSNDKGLDSGSGSGQRAGDRRKGRNVRKNASSDWVMSYWNSVSSNAKKDC